MSTQTYRIVDDNDELIDSDLQGMTLFKAETALCRLLNSDVDCYIQDEV